MEQTPLKGPKQYFGELADPRAERARRHELLDIIIIAVCGVICSADSWVDIAEFGKAKLEWFQSFLSLPNGIPSHDTFGRVFARLEPEAFERCFLAWAQELGRRWAFSNVNAGAYYAEFFARLEQLDEVSWTAVLATDFRNAQIKDGKQAEFLMHESFPWPLVEKVGVFNAATVEEVREALAGASHKPIVEVERSWYY